MIEKAINDIITASDCETNKISDGYHTFGELYEHRIVLYIALCRIIKKNSNRFVWISRTHSDGSHYPGWFIMGINQIPGYQITYHLPEKYWSECAEFAHFSSGPPDFDGHSASDVLERIKNL